MAELSSGQVRMMARLARLRVSEADIEELAGELRRILDAFSVLAGLDVSRLEPTTQMAGPAAGRRDEPVPCLPREAALQHAPDAAAGHFRVPRVLS